MVPVAERRPPGFNVDLGFYDSEEVLSLPRKIRAAAIGVWTLCGSYSANKLSDGYVSLEALRDRGCTPAIRAALMSTVPEPLWAEAHAGGIQFTRWAKWQRTSDEVKAYREADAERKRKAREAKRNPTTSDNGETSERTPAGPSQSVRSDSGTPKTETKTETKTKEERALAAPAPPAPKAQRGQHLPENWRPSDSTTEWAQNNCPGVDLRLEFEKFCNHWHAASGQNARKRNWDMAFRNWLMNAKPALRVVNGSPMATSDLRVMQTQALKNQPATRLELE